MKTKRQELFNYLADELGVSLLEGQLMDVEEIVLRENKVDKTIKELRAAKDKFPKWPTDPLHAVGILGEEFGELQKAVLQVTYEPEKATVKDVKQEAIQTSAMALRFLMSLDEYVYKKSEQHIQDWCD